MVDLAHCYDDAIAAALRLPNTAELGKRIISFGGKHNGKTIEAAYKDDGWIRFMILRFSHSDMPQHRELFRYVRLMGAEAAEAADALKLQGTTVTDNAQLQLDHQSSSKPEIKKAAAGAMSPYTGIAAGEVKQEEADEKDDFQFVSDSSRPQAVLEDRVAKLESSLRQVVEQLNALTFATTQA